MKRKKRFVAMLLSLLMVFSICTSATYAEEDTVNANSKVEETVDENSDDETGEAVNDTNVLASKEVDVIDEETTETNVVTNTDETKTNVITSTVQTTDTSGSDEVQALIDELPTVDELSTFSTDELNDVYVNLQDANDAYEALSSDEQSLIDDSKLDELFDYFNSLTMETADEETSNEVTLNDGINVITTSHSNETYNIGDNIALMIEGTDNESIVFDNCTFNLLGITLKISGTQKREDNGSVTYYNGEVATKLFIGKNVIFNNCTFTATNGGKQGTQGWDAAIYFFGGDITLNGCTLSGNGWEGQFLGLYGSSGSVTFYNSNISTVGNVGGWSYAMYGASVLNLNKSTMTATGMKRASGGGNINAFYSGDLRTSYDAVNITDSIIDFSDNQAGGFAINNVNIHVTNSIITVNDNLGNACNSGYWIADNSSITMDGNRGGHALSCIGIEMSDSTLEILHNGYAGLYIQSKNSSFKDSTVDIRCNGEKLLSYTAGDVWLNSHTLNINNCTSNACEGSAWLGAVGRKGSVVTTENTSVVAYDLNSNAADNLKSNTTATLTNATIALNSESDLHTLFLNPWMTSSYARGNAESASNNDADLFSDDNVLTSDSDYIINGKTAKIGTLTTAQLSHHNYDWSNEIFVSEATVNNYGVVKYECTDVCDDYENQTDEHTYSFDCSGTYVYAPLVGLAFEGNGSDDEPVNNIPENQTKIDYNSVAETPSDPTRESASPDEYTWEFTGWYLDEDCTQMFDFSTALTNNWTVVYAGWKKVDVEYIDITYEWVSTDNPTDVTTPDSDTIKANTTYNSTPQDETKQEYTFDGWYLDEECTIPYVDGTVLIEDTILYGKWTKVTADTTPTTPDDPTTPTTPSDPEESKSSETTTPTTSTETTPSTSTTKTGTNDATTETVETNVKTGDNANIALYALILIIAMFGIVTIRRTYKRKQ